MNPLVSVEGMRPMRPAICLPRTTTWRSSSPSAIPWKARWPSPSACWTRRSVKRLWSMSWSSASFASTPPAWSPLCSSCTWCWTSSSSCSCSPWSSLARQVGGLRAWEEAGSALFYETRFSRSSGSRANVIFLLRMWVQGKPSPLLFFFFWRFPGCFKKRNINIGCLKLSGFFYINVLNDWSQSFKFHS